MKSVCVRAGGGGEVHKERKGKGREHEPKQRVPLAVPFLHKRERCYWPPKSWRLSGMGIAEDIDALDHVGRHTG